jgi:hypothetical protein
MTDTCTISTSTGNLGHNPGYKVLKLVPELCQVSSDGFSVHVEGGVNSCQVGQTRQLRSQDPQVLSKLRGDRSSAIFATLPDGITRKLAELGLIVVLPVEVTAHVPFLPVPSQCVNMELTLSVHGFLGLLKVLGKREYGRLNHSSNVAVVVLPDATVVLTAVHFEPAEWGEVVQDDRNADRLLARGVRDSTAVTVFREKGFY